MYHVNVRNLSEILLYDTEDQSSNGTSSMSEPALYMIENSRYTEDCRIFLLHISHLYLNIHFLLVFYKSNSFTAQPISGLKWDN